MNYRRALLLACAIAVSGCAAIFGLDPLELGAGAADDAGQGDGDADAAAVGDGEAPGDGGVEDGASATDGGIDGAPADATVDGAQADASSFVWAIDSARTIYAFAPGAPAATSTTKLVQLSANCITSGNDAVSDLARAPDGTLYAVSNTRLLRIDVATGQCTPIKQYDAGVTFPYAITFVDARALDASAPADASVLVGYNATSYFEVDTTTGNVSARGSLMPDGGATGYVVAGDLVSLADKGNRTYATLKKGGQTLEYLAEVDPKSGGIVQVIALTDRTKLWGLAYWAGEVYGFSNDSSIVRIDLDAGTTSLLATPGRTWLGATGTIDGLPPH